MNAAEEKKIAITISRVTIIINLALSVFKLAAGLISNSAAMISDAVHSASDVFSTVIVIIGFRLSSKKADKDHPYGHDRLECVASIILSVILAFTGFEIGRTAVSSLLDNNYTEAEIPGRFALTAAAVSIIVKELMYRYTIRGAKKINSGALKADAWHHRSDALSSVGALFGIAAARLGYPAAEPAACILICVFILKAALEIFKEAVDKMVDKSCPDEVVRKMKDIIESESGVCSLVQLKTRLFASKMYVDAVIAVDGSVTLADAHDVARRVHDDIEAAFPDVKHCMVHVDPAEEATEEIEK